MRFLWGSIISILIQTSNSIVATIKKYIYFVSGTNNAASENIILEIKFILDATLVFFLYRSQMWFRFFSGLPKSDVWYSILFWNVKNAFLYTSL